MNKYENKVSSINLTIFINWIPKNRVFILDNILLTYKFQEIPMHFYILNSCNSSPNQNF